MTVVVVSRCPWCGMGKQPRAASCSYCVDLENQIKRLLRCDSDGRFLPRLRARAVVSS